MSIQEQYRLTDSQLDAATRFIDLAGCQVIYLVQSASDPDVQYKVTWNRDFHRFACDPRCPANRHGIGCWHVRSALANELIYRQNVRAEREAAQRIAEEKAEMERLMMVKPSRPSEKAVKAAIKRNQPQGFSLLR